MDALIDDDVSYIPKHSRWFLNGVLKAITALRCLHKEPVNYRHTQ